LVTDLVQPTVGRNDLILLVLKQHQQPRNDADESMHRRLLLMMGMTVVTNAGTFLAAKKK